MKTINITINQLMLVIAGSTSIPLIAFVLGFNFSTYQHFPDSSLPLNALALNDIRTKSGDEINTDDETHSVDQQKTSEPIEIIHDDLDVVSLDADRLEPEVTAIDLDASIASLETVYNASTAQEDLSQELNISIKEVANEEEWGAQSNTPSNKQALRLEGAVVKDVFAAQVATALPEITSLPPYVIQLALFAEKERAIRWTRKNASKAGGIKIFTKNKSNEQVKYAVVAGFYTNKADAKLLGEQLNKKHHMDYYVAKSESLGHQILLAASHSVVASIF